MILPKDFDRKNCCLVQKCWHWISRYPPHAPNRFNQQNLYLIEVIHSSQELNQFNSFCDSLSLFSIILHISSYFPAIIMMITKDNTDMILLQNQ